MNQQTTTLSHWAWLKSMHRALFMLDETPLLGESHPFDWQKLAKEISERLGIKELKIEAGELIFREKDTLLQGIEKPHLICQIVSSALEGEVSFVISETAIHSLMHELLKIDPGSILSLPREFIDSFSRFIEAETLSVVNAIGFEKKLSLQLAARKEIPPFEATELCQDIWIQFGKERILARLIIHSLFRKSWQNFSFQAFGEMPSKERLEAIPIILHAQVGKSTLKLKEWMKAKAGDFLIMDHLYFDPEAKETKCLVTLAGKPLFFAQREDGHLKIVEKATQTEAYDTMVDKLNMNENDSHNADEAADETADDLFEEDDESLEKETPDAFSELEEEHAEEETEDELFEEEEEETAHPAEKKAIEKADALPEVKKVEAPKAVAHPAHAIKVGELSLQDIPITITCELAQIHTTAQKLLELAAGNILDLNLPSDSQVLLVVNGKIVGKGQILKIGDTLGVRIMEIGAVEIETGVS